MVGVSHRFRPCQAIIGLVYTILGCVDMCDWASNGASLDDFFDGLRRTRRRAAGSGSSLTTWIYCAYAQHRLQAGSAYIDMHEDCGM